MLDTLFSRIKEVLWPGSEAAALPMMDGALKPNRRLDDAAPVGEPLPGCDDLVVCADGALLVSAGSRIHRLYEDERSVWAECGGRIDALAADPASGTVFAAIAGQGVRAFDREGRATGALLDSVEGRALRCVTALAVLPDGKVAIAEGSADNTAEAWSRDLLERRASGRIVLAAADLKSATTIAADLAWPSGLLPRSDGSLWFSEAWRHRIRSIGVAGGIASPVLDNLPGYPGRISADASGDLWLACFALRTQLIEFVLRERGYCEQMLAAVDPRYWIAPSLRATGHYLEPLQGGAIKKLGIVKPWAPPRSYGLVLRLSADGTILDSLHSRAGGEHHGITSVRRRGDRVIAVSRGGGRLLSCTPGGASA